MLPVSRTLGGSVVNVTTVSIEKILGVEMVKGKGVETFVRWNR